MKNPFPEGARKIFSRKGKVFSRKGEAGAQNLKENDFVHYFVHYFVLYFFFIYQLIDTK